MKTAIFHNYLDNIGGAERVVFTLARELNADVYTTNIDKEKIKKMGFGDLLNRIHSIGKVPISPPFKQQLALWKFTKLNLGKKYDNYIIAGDWAFSGAKHNKPSLWYIHSPARELWDLYQYTKKYTVEWYKRPIFDLWVRYNRHLTKRYIKKVDKLVCNSDNTKKRIKKYLKKEAKVINPPIVTSEFKFKKYGNFWLSVNRFITHKRVEMQMKAFSKMPEEKLIVVGSYEKAEHFKRYAEYLRKIKPSNVEIRSWLRFDELIKLYADCKGFITTSKDEDFGMTPIEAMAAGKPVIAPNEGGYKESIVDGKTGMLIDDLDVDKLIKAVRKIGKNPGKYKNTCEIRAMNFDTKKFIKKIKREIIK